MRRHRGVYRVGHAAPSVEADLMAAVLAGGQGSLVCGLAAAWLLELGSSHRQTGAPVPEVATTRDRSVPGVRIRRVRRIHPRDRIVVRGIPCTSVPRTLVDLAGALDGAALAAVVHRAQARYRTAPEHVEAVLARIPNAPGTRALRRAIAGDDPATLSELEWRFLRLLEKHGLPGPEVNSPAGSFVVDCRWPEHGVTVELDGYRFHNSRRSWERDRRREREAYARGDEFRRYTWADVTEDPAPILRELRPLLHAE